MPENVGLIASVRSQNLNPFKSFVSKKHKLKVKEEAKTEIIYVNSYNPTRKKQTKLDQKNE